MPLQFWKVYVTKIFMGNLNSISTGLLESNINILRTGELVAVGESVRASYHVRILLFENLCFSKRMYVWSLFLKKKKKLLPVGVLNLCVQNLCLLYIFYFSTHCSLLVVIFYMQNRPFS